MNSWIGLAVLVTMSTSACNNSNSDYEQQKALELIDSLHVQLNQVKSKLSQIDFADIVERKEFIEQELKLIQMYNSEIPADDVLLQALEEYRALTKIYRNALRHSKEIVMETEELTIQINTLKKTMQTQQYQKEEFKTYLQQEKEDVAQLIEYANIYLDPILETEHFFFKRMEVVSKFTDAIRLKYGIEP